MKKRTRKLDHSQISKYSLDIRAFSFVYCVKIFGDLISAPFHMEAKESVPLVAFIICVKVGKNIEIISSETKDSYQTFLCIHSVRQLWPLFSEK